MPSAPPDRNWKLYVLPSSRSGLTEGARPGEAINVTSQGVRSPRRDGVVTLAPYFAFVFFVCDFLAGALASETPTRRSNAASIAA
jgi:hypothetical protein